ncbi:hypothetical protein BG842_26290 [Haladaptatus sp. W1]|nr:hypothetical protein BG842_26290 [Haladaptatus sp. W1]
MNHIFALCVKITEERILPATEMEKRHWSRSAGIHTEIASFHRMTELASIAPTVRKQARGIAETASVDDRKRVCEVFSTDQRQHRTNISS